MVFRHHDHSSSSNRVAVISSRSPSGSNDDTASAQPALGWADGLMVKTPGAASISTSSVSPATSSSGFAMRIPLELPILTSFARTKTTPSRRAQIAATLAASAHCPALANAHHHPPEGNPAARLDLRSGRVNNDVRHVRGNLSRIEACLCNLILCCMQEQPLGSDVAIIHKKTIECQWITGNPLRII